MKLEKMSKAPDQKPSREATYAGLRPAQPRRPWSIGAPPSSIPISYAPRSAFLLRFTVALHRLGLGIAQDDFGELAKPSISLSSGSSLSIVSLTIAGALIER